MYIKNKMLLYYAQIHANQLEHKENKKITKTITINIIDFKYFSSNEYHKKIFLKDNNQKETLEIHTLELPKFEIKSWKKLNREELWMLYFSTKNSNEISDIINQSIYIKKLDKLLDNYWKEETLE